MRSTFLALLCLFSFQQLIATNSWDEQIKVRTKNIPESSEKQKVLSDLKNWDPEHSFYITKLLMTIRDRYDNDESFNYAVNINIIPALVNLYSANIIGTSLPSWLENGIRVGALGIEALNWLLLITTSP